jgi:hypothetical protein
LFAVAFVEWGLEGDDAVAGAAGQEIFDDFAL